MKRYILFAFSLLMAFPLGVFAQDDDTEDEDFDFLKPKRTATVKKNYETRTIKGTVFDGATKQPLAGAIVRAAEVDGYSVLTNDDGTFELKLPLFASAIYVTSPDHNPVRMGLVKAEKQQDVMLYPLTFTAEYGPQANVLGDYSATDFKYTNAINIMTLSQQQTRRDKAAMTYITLHESGMSLRATGLMSSPINCFLCSSP